MSSQVFEKGAGRLEQDIDLMSIVETIHKLKAATHVLIKNDQNLLKKIKYNYYRQATLESDDSEDERGKDQLIGFLNRTEK